MLFLFRPVQGCSGNCAKRPWRTLRERRTTPGSPGSATRGRWRLRVVLRRALRHHAIRLDREAVGLELSLEDDFRTVLEGVGHDARIARGDHLAIERHLEPVLQRSGTLPEIGDVSVELQLSLIHI